MNEHAGRVSSLVGRDAERQRLDQALAALGRGQGGLVLISGETGIGKTALATACGASARDEGAIFVVGRCYERGPAPAFGPWHEALDDLIAAGVLDVAAMPPPFGRGPAPDTSFELMRSVVARLRERAAVHPLVLLLDDAHWADQETLELLDLTTRQIERVPLLVVVTYRDDELVESRPLHAFMPQLRRNRPVVALHLRPMTVVDVAALVEERHGPGSSALASYLHDRAEGNPLFATCLLDELIDRGRLPRDAAGRWLPPAGDEPVPLVPRFIIEQRLARLGEEAIALLDMASVAGAEWELPVVEAALGWPEERLLGALEQALASRFILTAAARDERYRFAHGLIRDVVHNRLLARRRKHLHGRVLDALALGAPNQARPAMLAHHATMAERWSEAVVHGLAAGDAARDRFAYHNASLRYREALGRIMRHRWRPCCSFRSGWAKPISCRASTPPPGMPSPPWWRRPGQPATSWPWGVRSAG